MRQYLLDSAPLAGYLHGRQSFVELIIPFIREHQAATSILVYAEVIEYLKGLPDFPRRRHQLQTLLREIYPYFLTYAIVERYADIRRAMRAPHGPGLIGDVDTLIAATALEGVLKIMLCPLPSASPSAGSSRAAAAFHSSGPCARNPC
jgi:predicted nucleic acid-binding protein